MLAGGVIQSITRVGPKAALHAWQAAWVAAIGNIKVRMGAVAVPSPTLQPGAAPGGLPHTSSPSRVLDHCHSKVLPDPKGPWSQVSGKGARPPDRNPDGFPGAML